MRIRACRPPHASKTRVSATLPNSYVVLSSLIPLSPKSTTKATSIVIQQFLRIFFWKRWRIISKRKIRSSVKLRHCYWSDLRNHFASSSCCRRRSSFDSLLLGLIPSTIAVRIAPYFSIIQIEAWYLVSSKTAEEPE